MLLLLRAELSEGGGKGGSGKSGKHSDCVYVCEYVGGRLAHEEALSSEDVEGIFGPMQVCICTYIYSVLWLCG